MVKGRVYIEVLARCLQTGWNMHKEDLPILCEQWAVHPDLFPDEPCLYQKLVRAAREAPHFAREWVTGWPKEARWYLAALITDELYFLFMPHAIQQNRANAHLYVVHDSLEWLERHHALKAVVSVVHEVPGVWDQLDQVRTEFDAQLRASGM